MGVGVGEEGVWGGLWLRSGACHARGEKEDRALPVERAQVSGSAGVLQQEGGSERRERTYLRTRRRSPSRRSR